jgi:hypothetical protein
MFGRKLIFLYATMEMYRQERVSATESVRMGTLTVSGDKLLIVVYFRHQSACKVQQVPPIFFVFSFEELVINMSVASALSACL